MVKPEVGTTGEELRDGGIGTTFPRCGRRYVLGRRNISPSQSDERQVALWGTDVTGETGWASEI
jgi:hypothetical protein